MTYTVLARRYRSRDFDELVGQEPIARTLKNAIAAGRTAHAYLFCGTRGVGKTSMARIFAKALNVSEDLEQAGEVAEAILRGEDLDVIEIDGASNRGIQEARDLIAGAGLSPARCPYKIYIIDEVHMLTPQAFNALLKTMEEPPAHVKFILCTTDPGKVLTTIQSRCQRFDFRAIPTPLIADQLRRILEEEGIEAEEAVIIQVARLGNGSMRDALSLLDRLIAAGDKKLTAELADQMLGLPDRSLVSGLVEAFVAGDPRAGLEAGAELLARGSTPEQALEMLAEHLRTLMLVAACGPESSLLELPSDALAAAGEQAGHFDPAALVHMMALCDATARRCRDSATARALFDATIVRLCLSEHFADIPALLAGEGGGGPASPSPAPRRKKKESELTGAVPAPPAAAVPRASAAAPTDPAGDAALVEVKDERPPEAPVGDEDLWPSVLRVAAASAGDQARVRHLRFRSFDGRTLRLAVDESGSDSARFLATQAAPVAELVRRATGRRVKVHIDGPRPAAAPRRADSHAIEDAMRMPLVKKAMDLFGAVVTDVREPRPEPPPTPAATEHETEGAEDV
ncbi:MAG: DNA polymerase III subunit gamma/tau [Planctomycetota bacterium]|nr:DNA polymerase III subunit gamma/tau [Planctomycetota bacterium]